MSSSAAFFKILYQNETLFRLDTPFVQEVLPEKKEHAATEDKAVKEATVINPETGPKVTAHKPTPVLPPTSIPAPQPIARPILPVEAVPNVPSPAANPATFPALQHSILILIDEPKQKGMTGPESVFLDNILKAVGHSVEKADILNYSFLKGPDARKVLSEKQTNFFITFGVPLIKLHLDLLLMPYTPKMVEGVWFLLTDSLPVIEADRNLKKKLWQALQKMFEMS
jgi:hypothetical protein